MIVVGIDPSLSNLAACVGDERGLRRMACFRSTSLGRTAERRMRRYEQLAAEVLDWLEDLQLVIDLFVIEGYASGLNIKTTIDLAEFGGILRYNLVDVCEHIYEPHPSTLKKFVGGYLPAGKAGPKKTGVITAIVQTFSQTFPTDDEYDAFGLYQMGLCAAGITKPKNQVQREALDTMLGLKNKTKADKQAAAQKRVDDLFQPPY